MGGASINKSAAKTRPIVNLVPEFMNALGLPKGNKKNV